MSVLQPLGLPVYLSLWDPKLLTNVYGPPWQELTAYFAEVVQTLIVQSVIGGEFDLLAAADFIDVDDRSNITHGKPASPAIINLLGRVAFGARAGARRCAGELSY